MVGPTFITISRFLKEETVTELYGLVEVDLNHKGYRELTIISENGLCYREVRGGRGVKVGFGTICDLFSIQSKLEWATQQAWVDSKLFWGR